MNISRIETLKEKIKDLSFTSRLMSSIGILSSIGTVCNAKTKGILSFDSILFATMSILLLNVARSKHKLKKSFEEEVKTLEKTI